MAIFNSYVKLPEGTSFWMGWRNRKNSVCVNMFCLPRVVVGANIAGKKNSSLRAFSTCLAGYEGTCSHHSQIDPDSVWICFFVTTSIFWMCAPILPSPAVGGFKWLDGRWFMIINDQLLPRTQNGIFAVSQLSGYHMGLVHTPNNIYIYYQIVV